MKNKSQEQKENTKKNSNKISENKENTNKNNKEKDPSLIGDKTKSAAGEKSKEDSTTDKAVSAEKSMEEKLAELQDKYIRLSAEFDNYRKRTLREKMDLTKYAEENTLLKIIPLMDDFDRALQHMEKATDCKAMKNGIELIYGKFNDFFRQSGIKEIESIDCDFNVDLHEAVAKTPVEDADKKGKVVDVILKGYYLHDKILRFSKVVIGE